MGDIFISHSSAAGPQVNAFLEALPPLLEQRGLLPFLDESMIQPGDVWRPVLHRELARCSGAVLVLGPEALERPWVLQEATILAWRRALRAYNRRSMVVVAALLDGATRQDVEARFPALNLGETEFARPVSTSPDAARNLAARVAGQFPAGRDRSDPLQAWTARVGEWLGKLGELALLDVAGALDVDTGVDDDQLCDAVAEAFFSHDGTLQELERALVYVVNSRAKRAGDILTEVAPVVVPASTAQVLLSAACQPPGERVAAINSEDLRVARLFVRRATCCDPMVLLAEAPQQMGESEDDLYLAVRQAIAEAVGVFEPDVLAPDDLRQLDRPLIVLIRRRSWDNDKQGIPHEVLSRVLARLRRELDTCVFLVLTGSEYDKDIRALIGLPGLAEPPLRREDAVAWSKMINRLYRQAGLEMMA